MLSCQYLDRTFLNSNQFPTKTVKSSNCYHSLTFSRFVCLHEKPTNATELCCCLDQVLEDGQTQEIPPMLLANIKSIVSLMSSAKDRALLQFVLSTIYSGSQLRYAFGYSSLCINKNDESKKNS